ncbi:DNA-directed RNA polymerase subunit alpha [Lagierella massiliensis]|uniref:DNA-directed RNA polymerase subunit alpha n=1 Tax=Lagierella massiliensis TaxID=1689303 RepID=UPI0006D80221|nr:DNA-directed RNA polymerase subunit alpha [Lagierella massiliensis]
MTQNLMAKIEIADINEEKNHGKFVIAPLERGFGTTLGNGLRRVLLSSLPGSAVTKVHIQDVLHEFSTIKGVLEDVSELILNIKGIALKSLSEEPINIDIDLKGPCIFTAKDIEQDVNLEVAKPDQYIATLNEDAHLKMSLRIENGKGYRVSDLNKSEEDPIGVIPIDSTFTPVTKVNFEITELVSNKEKLELDIWTDGTISSQDALAKGAKILTDYLALFIDLPEYTFEEEVEEEEESSIEGLLSTSIEELDLSLRSFNCLKRSDINTVGDIISKGVEELSKIKNFGRKSFEEVESKIHELGLEFSDKED